MARIGSGGAGDVWQAEAPGGLRVALKIVPLGDGLGRREMANLKILRAVRHPNLLAYFGAWQAEGRLIIGMELADRSLWDRFLEARQAGLAGIPRGELLGILGDVARVVDFLNEPRHELEGRTRVAIHHRDIKPQNIMLIGHGVKVADFGLSCLDEPLAPGRSQCGLTFAYAAPEQFRGRVSAAADQYSLAITFAQLRAGRLPFLGPPAAVMMGHLFGEPDLAIVPAPERPAIARALAKDPTERWPDCRTLLAALAECAEAPDTFEAEGVETPSDQRSSAVVIAPLSGPWNNAASVSSGLPAPADHEPAASVYLMGPADVDAPTPAVASSLMTVRVHAAGSRRRFSPIYLTAAALLAGVICWSLWARPHGRAAVPSSSGRDRTEDIAIASTVDADPREATGRTKTGPRRLANVQSARPEVSVTSAPRRERRRPEPPSALPRPSDGRPALADRHPSTPAPKVAWRTIRATWTPDLSTLRPRYDHVMARTRAVLASLRTASRQPTGPPRVAEPPGPAPPREPARPEVRVAMPDLLEIQAGCERTIPIRIERGEKAAALSVEFRGLPPAVRIPAVSLPAGSRQGNAVIQARLDADDATVPVTMIVRGGPVPVEATFRLSVHSDPARLSRTRGHTLLALGRPAEAVAAFDRAVQAGISDPFVFNNRGLAHFALGQLDPAIRDYTEASRLRPNDPVIRYNRGVAYARRGDDVRALLDFDLAIRLRPDYARAYEARAAVYLRRGDRARSETDAARARELAQHGVAPAVSPASSTAPTLSAFTR
ncbi:MAG: protein kinase domain-containing protein [Isosphaeraceae bacterium]